MIWRARRLFHAPGDEERSTLGRGTTFGNRFVGTERSNVSEARDPEPVEDIVFGVPALGQGSGPRRSHPLPPNWKMVSSRLPMHRATSLEDRTTHT